MSLCVVGEPVEEVPPGFFLLISLSSKATTMSSKPLMGYREKLFKSGFGPYRGPNVPSSGFVAAYAMLSSELCKSVDVYGFVVVDSMAQASKGLQTRAGEVLDRTKVQKQNNNSRNVIMSYHYFTGLGARTEGNDVHSFDTEEKALRRRARKFVDILQIRLEESNQREELELRVSLCGRERL